MSSCKQGTVSEAVPCTTFPEPAYTMILNKAIFDSSCVEDSL